MEHVCASVPPSAADLNYSSQHTYIKLNKIDNDNDHRQQGKQISVISGGHAKAAAVAILIPIIGHRSGSAALPHATTTTVLEQTPRLASSSWSQ